MRSPSRVPGVRGGERINVAFIDADLEAGNLQHLAFGGTGQGRISLADHGRDTWVEANLDADADIEFFIVIKDGANVAASAYSERDFVLDFG